MTEISRTSHLDYVDFIKGIAAISVIFLHTFPESALYSSLAVYHIWQAVPVFLFITFFLGFRNLETKSDCFRGYYSKERIIKILKRVWLPLIILASVEALFFYVVGDKQKAVDCLSCYDNGPGSYYIWCYMQIWLMLPAIYYILKRLGILTGGGILLIVGVLLDYLWERYIGLKPGYTCFRYLFLSVPAFLFVKGVNIKRMIPLFILSIIYLALMLYSKVPIFADPVLPNGWEAQTSFGFFYTLLLFVLLSKFYDGLKSSIIKKYISHLGTMSWEIFVVQMVLIGSGVLNFASTKLFHSTIFQIGFKVIVALFVTLLFAELYKRLLNAMVRVKH